MIFKAKQTKRLLTIMLALLMLMPAAPAFADLKTPLKVEVVYGYNGIFRPLSYAPVTVTIENNGKDFNGKVCLLLPDSYGETIQYEKNISVAAGTKKSVTFSAYIRDYTPTCRIKLISGKKEVFSELIDCPDISSFDSSSSYTGLLTDDRSALSYLNGKVFKGMASSAYVKNTIMQFDENTLVDESRSLEMFDTIIIANYATDKLSSAQIKAIISWVKAGGLLILSTGDSADRVLSGFKNTPVSVNPGPLRSVKTSYGKSGLSYDSLNYALDNYYDENLSSAELSAFVKGIMPVWDEYKNNDALLSGEHNETTKFVNDNLQLFRDIFWDNYYGDPYSTFVQEFPEEAVNEATDEFTDYCVDFICLPVLGACVSYDDTHANEKNQDSNNITLSDGLITDINGLTPLIYGDNGVNKYDYNFAAYKPLGKGNVCYLATDITKTPFVKSPYNSEVIMFAIEKIKGDKILENFGSALSKRYYSSSGYSEYLYYFLKNISAKKLIPVLIYVLILAFYSIAAFVVFFVLKKKKKSVLLWPIHGALALSAVLVISLISFGTRIKRPVSTVTRIITAKADGTVDEQSYVTLTLPRSKTYTINFDKSVEIGSISRDIRYLENENTMNSFSVAYPENPDAKTVMAKAFYGTENKHFELDSFPDSYVLPEVNAKYKDGAVTGTVKNTLGEPLENCMICTYMGYVDIGTIEAGETVDLSTKKFVSTYEQLRSYYHYKSLIDCALSFDDMNGSAVMLGLNSKKYINLRTKRSMLNYLIDTTFLSDLELREYYRYSSGMITQSSDSETQEEVIEATRRESPLGFIGFTTEDEKSFLADKANCDEYKTTLILIEIKPETGINETEAN